MSHAQVFHEQDCVLGEGLLYSFDALLWLDIARSKLMKKMWGGTYSEYRLPEQASAIWKVRGDLVILASESGLCSFNIKSGEWAVIGRIPHNKKNIDMRANDGGSFDQHIYLFGTMQKQPTGLFGALYLTNGEVTEEIFQGIGIPNTFVKLDNCRMLISDSFEKKIYIYDIDVLEKKVVSRLKWLDLSDKQYTPDGGCISKSGNVYIAMWGGACVHEYDKFARLIRSYAIPALKPTNCVLSIDEKTLFITSAREDMSNEELQEYPLSGSVFKIYLVM
jgi:sugar lactone lactonase YvrE